MNLHLLRIFAAVAEQGSFSRAASALFISQPAVSKAVRQLERQLDLALIERGAGGTRGTRGVRLTDSGQALFEHARGIFALERAATEEVRARVGSKRGRLGVGASTTIAGYWLPPYVAQFARQVPGAQLQIRVGNTQAIGEALINCEIDLALVEGQVNDARIAANHWRDDELQIIAHRDAPLARRDAR
jgi:molybdate transport repressor ModE-like protein